MKSKNKGVDKDPIEVVCRVRPLQNPNDLVCLKVKDSQTLVLFPSEISQRCKEIHCSFKEVISPDVSQQEVFDKVALPFVEGLLEGSNGLIFTYGITSSGKTYTMTGSPDDGGLLPRSLDVLFNSIAECSTMKFVFKPDKLNGFDIQSATEAKLDIQKERRALNKTFKTLRRDKTTIERLPYSAVVKEVPPDVNFAVFISYVEIYNNYIYDLLDETPVDPKKKINLNSKMLREDSMHNMYVFGVTESEVKTVDEALDLFYKGQIRRKVSHTALNAESSRSHSVFTIRVVQAPLDPQGMEILLDKDLITVSQLSLVDLAGSERNVRTRTQGQHMREAGNINSSLMTLRNCLDALRESQIQNNNKKIPYRESKLTHLFKTYFEGQGKIKMVVCVNPLADYYEETIHVMKFSEMAQDVLITRPESIYSPVQVAMTPGRGKLYKDALKKAHEEGVSVSSLLTPTIYNLGPDFPITSDDSWMDEMYYIKLSDFLDARNARRKHFNQDLNAKHDEFRLNLSILESESNKLKQEKTLLQTDLNCREKQIKVLEAKLLHSEEQVEEMDRQNSKIQHNFEDVTMELQRIKGAFLELNKDMEKMKKSYQKMACDKDRMKKYMEKRLAEKHAELERKMCFTDEKFRQLREILNSDDWDDYGVDPVMLSSIVPDSTTFSSTLTQQSKNNLEIPSRLNVTSVRTRSSSAGNVFISVATTSEKLEELNKENKVPTKSLAVANPRHRRSRSNTTDKWIEHKPIGNLDMGTVLQPCMKKKKSVTDLKLKDIAKSDVSKYVLEHQEQDSKGAIETKLYKADVIPSAGGGVQVVYNDVEQLKQVSPPHKNLRKRNSDGSLFAEIENKPLKIIHNSGGSLNRSSKIMRKN